MFLLPMAAANADCCVAATVANVPTTNVAAIMTATIVGVVFVLFI